MVAITVSREHGSDGTDIAHRVAERLHARYLDREVIDMAFQLAGLPVPEAQPALAKRPPIQEKEVPGLTRRIVEAVTGPIVSGLQPWPRAVPRQPGPVGEDDSLLRQVLPNDEAYVSVLTAVFNRLLEDGRDVVIIGRGGQCILAGRANVLHVHITAPLTYRIQQVIQREDLGADAAAALVRRKDEERARYIRRYHAADWLQPSLYHLIINLAWFTPEQAIALVLQAAEMKRA
ncbi:MAG: cytidylate kinase-like family protein [Anaerolineae bacterium]